MLKRLLFLCVCISAYMYIYVHVCLVPETRRQALTDSFRLELQVAVNHHIDARCQIKAFVPNPSHLFS